MEKQSTIQPIHRITVLIETVLEDKQTLAVFLKLAHGSEKYY